MVDRYRKLSPFAIAFANEYKGFMKSKGITNLEIAEVLGRNDGYVSERANGRRALDVDDVDALASLVDGWNGQSLMIELSRRARGNLISNVVPSTDDEHLDEDWDITLKDVTKRDVDLIANRGSRKADEPHAE